MLQIISNPDYLIASDWVSMIFEAISRQFAEKIKLKVCLQFSPPKSLKIKFCFNNSMVIEETMNVNRLPPDVKTGSISNLMGFLSASLSCQWTLKTHKAYMSERHETLYFACRGPTKHWYCSGKRQVLTLIQNQ